MSLRKIIRTGIEGLAITTTIFVGVRAMQEIKDYKEFYKNEASLTETVGGLIPDYVNIECKYNNGQMIKTMKVGRPLDSNFEMEFGAYDGKLNELGLTTKRNYKYDGHLSSHMNQARESLASKVEKEDTHQELVRKIKTKGQIFYRENGPKELFVKADKLWEEYWNKAEGDEFLKEWKFYNSPKQQNDKKTKEAIDAL
ncbi:MAG: hypothetical protein KJ939_03950 [Nanoarchaeota archaeon]|nr:hypothetical protein [Nanoarchaeota archaeon]MCG2719371.1 hypothetical protein [Nanoarchaeota archaeon]